MGLNQKKLEVLNSYTQMHRDNIYPHTVGCILVKREVTEKIYMRDYADDYSKDIIGTDRVEDSGVALNEIMDKYEEKGGKIVVTIKDNL